MGGEDHKTGQADDAEPRWARLEAWTRARVPIDRVVFRWSGEVMEPVDRIGLIGRNPNDHDNVFIVTGDTGSLYAPTRVRLRATPAFLGEAANMAAQYADWLTPGEVRTIDAIPRGGGAVIRRGLTKVAVHRDEHGTVHECSAVCPHLGCIVDWNAAERTWDCPCHGSRFDARGGVLNGPAMRDLGESRAEDQRRAS